MAEASDLETLKKTLRARLRSGKTDATLAAAELRLLLDEMGRLQQGNDRLRRQNRRVRLKLQRAGIAEDAPEAGEPGDSEQP